MDISHSFRFQWNDHVPHLSQIFSELRFDETYCETTLITDDGYVLKAHAAILMSTSRYFERILAGISSDQHPIVVLKGVNFPELSCILDYIYQGSIQVHQHLMEQVLDTADILEVKGLSNMKNNLSVRKLIAPSLSRSSSMSSSPSKSPIPPSPSSPSEIYASSSAAALKPDMEEHTEERASSPKQKHSSAPDVRLVDSGEYLPASSRKPVATSIAPVPTASASSTSEHLDQTLGIDLSLSRVSNEDSERNCSKTVYEDSFFRKRKHLGEECVPHRKKRLFNRAENGVDITSNDSYYKPQTVREEIIHTKLPINGLEPDFGKLPKEDPDQYLGHISQHSFLDYSDWDSSSALYNEVECHRPKEEKDVTYSLEDLNNRGENSRPENLDLDVSDSFPFMSSSECTVSPQRSEAAVDEELESHLLPRNVPRRSHSFCSPSKGYDGGWSESSESARNKDARNRCRSGDAGAVVDVEELFSVETPSSRENLVLDVTDLVAVKVHPNEGHDEGSSGMFKNQTREMLNLFDTRLRRPASKVKRPLSKYTLFMKETYHSVAIQNPEKRSKDVIKILSGMWKNLSPKEKEEWERRANNLQREFKKQNPDYVFHPKKFQMEKFEYNKQKEERRNMFRINPFLVPKTF